jgi:hypothetical protein
VCVCRGAETQCLFIEVLKPRSSSQKPSVRLSRSWNPGPRAKYRGPETQVLRAKCSNTHVYCTSLCKNTTTATEEESREESKPRSWKPNAATLAFIALHYVKTRRQQQKKRVARAKYRGPETQVLKAKCSNIRVYCTSLCKNTAAATEKKSRFFLVPCRALQAQADCVRPSQLPTSS